MCIVPAEAAQLSDNVKLERLTPAAPVGGLMGASYNGALDARQEVTLRSARSGEEERFKLYRDLLYVSLLWY